MQLTTTLEVFENSKIALLQIYPWVGFFVADKLQWYLGFRASSWHGCFQMHMHIYTKQSDTEKTVQVWIVLRIIGATLSFLTISKSSFVRLLWESS